MSKKIVLIGAGSAQFGFGTLGDIFQSKTLTGATVMLHDINGEALSKVADTAKKFIADENLQFTAEASIDRKEALRAADFVIISIEIGDRFELWDQDRTIPQQYGITQIYGENGGPGGVFHSLRIIPPILDICDDIVSLCPDAYVFCYSNPMTAICTAVHRKHPALKFIGLCHEIASLRRYMPSILDVPYESLDLVAGGLNHFSALLKAVYRDSGRDAYPDILERAPEFFQKEPGYSDLWRLIKEHGVVDFTEGAREKAEGLIQAGTKAWADRGLFKHILERFKLLPITVDSHFGEYISWAHDVADHRGIIDFLEFYRFYLSHAQAKIELVLKERIVPIMDGILADSGYIEEAVNVPNTGLIPSLPDFVAVEVPAVIDAKGVHGQVLPDLPRGFAALLRNYTGVYDLTAEAVLHKSRDLAIQAILVSPVTNVGSRVPEMVDLMISMQPQWLGYLK